jgi:hypothetical protein
MTLTSNELADLKCLLDKLNENMENLPTITIGNGTLVDANGDTVGTLGFEHGEYVFETALPQSTYSGPG